MFYKNSHLSDEQLLLAADGELPERRRRMAQRHLESCWTCRKRMAELQRTIEGVVDCYHSLFEAEMSRAGGGPEALLRARLTEASDSVDAGGRHWQWLSMAAAVQVIALMTAVLLRTPRTQVTPNPRLTPGETVPVSKSEVCRDTGGDNGPVPEELREAVFSEYGLNKAQRNAYEVDFLITPALGGSASLRNLWPEPYNSRSWNAHTKDVLERRLHMLVCKGQIDLSTAQRDIAANWVQAYKKYVGGDSVF